MTFQRKSELTTELSTLFKLALPLVISSATNYFCRLLTTIFAGHYLSTIEFDAVALGLSVTNITGYSMIIAFVSPMDSLCTQANGAQNWKLFSISLWRAVLCTCCMLIPVILLWSFMYRLLLLCGQNVIVAGYVYQWTRIYIAILPAYVALSVLIRFLSSQGIGRPLFYLSFSVYCIWHPLWLYFIFVYLEKRDFIYAPLCNIVSIYLHVICLFLYCKWFHPHHPLSYQSIEFARLIQWKTNWKCDTFIDKHIQERNTNIHVVDKGLSEYVTLMIAGIFSLCAEWWSFEVITFLCGLLGPTQLAAHVVFATIIPLYYMVPLGVGLAGASRIGSLIGQNKFYLAKQMGDAILWFTLAEGTVIAVLSFIFRDSLSRLFTRNELVTEIAIKLSPWFCVFIIWDAFQGSFQGCLRGIKRQGKSVIGVVIGPWLVCIPLSCWLAFDPRIDLKIFGMWIGQNVGYAIMVAVFFYFWWSFDWDQEQHPNVLPVDIELNATAEADVANNNKSESTAQYIDSTTLQCSRSPLNLMSISHFSAFISVQRSLD